MKHFFRKYLYLLIFILLSSQCAYALSRVDLSTGYYPNPDIGKALSNANIYVGVVDLDPVVVANQKQISVLQEDGTTINVSQPVTTSAGGVPQYNGSPVTILVDGSYSIKVTDSVGTQIYYVPQNFDTLEDALVKLEPFDSIADLRAITYTPVDGQVVNVLGYYAKTENQDWSFKWDSTSTATDDNGTIIKATSIATGRWERLYSGLASVKWYGAKGDGVTDDLTAIQTAFDNHIAVFFPTGVYGISDTLTKDASGFQMIGESEDSVSIIPLAGFVGTSTDSDGNKVMLDLGNTTTSRNANMIRHIKFEDTVPVNNITAILWNRINNQSKIHHCKFGILERAIEFDNLALGNSIAFNKFGPGTVDAIKLVGVAGNSTIIQSNYFNGGRIYLNDSMTDVKIIDNVMDAGASILTDGGVGSRNVIISRNRFEWSSVGTTFLTLGFTRGIKIVNNFFQGNNGLGNSAIVFGVNSAGQSGTLHDNTFEGVDTTLISIPSIAGNEFFVYNNIDDGTAATPYINTDNATFNIKGTMSLSGLIGVSDSFELTSSSKLSRTTDSGYQRIDQLVIPSSVVGGGQDIFTITTDGTQGSYTCYIDYHLGFDVTSTAAASAILKESFTHVNASDNSAADSSVIVNTALQSAATAAGTRNITAGSTSLVSTSDSIRTVNLNLTLTGTGAVTVFATVSVVWTKYATAPVITGI